MGKILKLLKCDCNFLRSTLLCSILFHSISISFGHNLYFTRCDCDSAAALTLTPLAPTLAPTNYYFTHYNSTKNTIYCVWPLQGDWGRGNCN